MLPIEQPPATRGDGALGVWVVQREMYWMKMTSFLLLVEDALGQKAICGAKATWVAARVEE